MHRSCGTAPHHETLNTRLCASIIMPPNTRDTQCTQHTIQATRGRDARLCAFTRVQCPCFAASPFLVSFHTPFLAAVFSLTLLSRHSNPGEFRPFTRYEKRGVLSPRCTIVTFAESGEYSAFEFLGKSGIFKYFIR